jgi:organic radical activating enzyme
MTLPQNFDQKSGFPYLVDIKLTDYCTFGCPFCYQSSTKDGNHADSWWAGRVLADFLFKSNVLEVNFGGGDPTLYKKNHHNLSEIIRHYHSKKFKVGITTKNYKWWKSSNFKESLKYIDSLAISVNSLNEVEDAKKLVSEIQKGSDNYPKIYFQCIHELSSYDDFKKLLVELANFYHSNITLLGYKSFGFGQDKKIHNYPVEWIDFVKNLSDKKSVNIGVD